MNEPKIAVANLPAAGSAKSLSAPAVSITPITPSGAPSPKGPSTPASASLPSRPSNPVVQSIPREKANTTLDLVFKVGFVVAAIAAAFFFFRNTSTKSDLTQAKADNSQLQLQLTQAKADTVKAQANATELSDALLQLQAKEKRLQSDAATAKASNEKATQEITRLQSDLKKSQNEAAMAKANAAKAADDLAKQQTRLVAQAKPAAAAPIAQPVTPTVVASSVRAKPMPLNVSFKKAELGDGNAMLLQNISSSTLTVAATFSNAASGASKVFHLVLDAGATKELGSLGAWKLAPGDRIQIDSAGYDPIVRTAL